MGSLRTYPGVDEPMDVAVVRASRASASAESVDSPSPKTAVPTPGLGITTCWVTYRHPAPDDDGARPGRGQRWLAPTRGIGRVLAWGQWPISQIWRFTPAWHLAMDTNAFCVACAGCRHFLPEVDSICPVLE